MFNVFLLILNFAFSLAAGVVFAAAVGVDWWPLTFLIGFLLWNVAAAGIVLAVGFVLGNTDSKGD